MRLNRWDFPYSYSNHKLIQCSVLVQKQSKSSYRSSAHLIYRYNKPWIFLLPYIFVLLYFAHNSTWKLWFEKRMKQRKERKKKSTGFLLILLKLYLQREIFSLIYEWISPLVSLINFPLVLLRVLVTLEHKEKCWENIWKMTLDLITRRWTNWDWEFAVFIFRIFLLTSFTTYVMCKEVLNYLCLFIQTDAFSYFNISLTGFFWKNFSLCLGI
jgi:hypothetical protein